MVFFVKLIDFELKAAGKLKRAIGISKHGLLYWYIGNQKFEINQRNKKNANNSRLLFNIVV